MNVLQIYLSVRSWQTFGGLVRSLLKRTSMQPQQPLNAFVAQANRLREQGRYAQAEVIFKQALALAEQSFGAEATELIAVLNNHAVLYKYTGQFDEAERLYRRALHLALRHWGEAHPDLATLYHNLGGLDHARGRFAEGEPAARRAVEVRRQALEAGHPQVTEAQLIADQAALAGLLDGEQKYEESEPIYHAVLAFFGRQLETGDRSAAYEIAINLNNLAAVYARTKRAAQAETLYQRSLALKEKLLGASHPDVAVTLNNLGMLLKSLGRNDEARENFRRALTILEKTLPAHHPKRQAIQANYARLCG